MSKSVGPIFLYAQPILEDIKRNKNKDMKTTEKKSQKRRNTALFYALMAGLPGYDRRYAEMIKEGIVNDYLTHKYGPGHRRERRLSALSDEEYNEMLIGLRYMTEDGKTTETLQREVTRKRLVHQILTALSRMGVVVTNGDYGVVNEHIRRLPISKGRIIPEFPTDELPRLLGAVRAYADNMRKKLRKEKRLERLN